MLVYALADVDEALSKSELAKAELEMDISKVRMEAAGLRDALLKMQNLNEGLAQDKADLNKLLMQVIISQFYRFAANVFVQQKQLLSRG